MRSGFKLSAMCIGLPVNLIFWARNPEWGKYKVGSVQNIEDRKLIHVAQKIRKDKLHIGHSS